MKAQALKRVAVYRMLEQILSDEEEHADELADMLEE